MFHHCNYQSGTAPRVRVITIPLILFAKAPIAGQVKTRLQSHCSLSQAADIAEILLTAALDSAIKHWPGRVILASWPDISHPTILKLSNEFSVQLILQGEGDLGDKMHTALEQFGYPAAIMGTDAPHIKPTDLMLAYKFLRNGNNVIGPSTDGGYYFLGLAKPKPSLFENIEWGTENVLQPTLERGEFELLTEMTDIDLWADVVEHAHLIPAIKNYLQHQLLL